MPRILDPPADDLPYEPTPHRKRLTRDERACLVQQGLLIGRHELVDGEIIAKMGQKRPHATTVMLITEWLLRVFGSLRVQCQGPIDVAGADNETNEPEPDAAVLTQPITAHANRNPGPSDLLLVVEVSDTTLTFDLRNKAALYARAGIMEYWVIDVNGQRLVVHRQPGAAGYSEVVEYAGEEMIAPQSRPDDAIRVADLLPPAQG